MGCGKKYVSVSASNSSSQWLCNRLRGDEWECTMILGRIYGHGEDEQHTIPLWPSHPKNLIRLDGPNVHHRSRNGAHVWTAMRKLRGVTKNHVCAAAIRGCRQHDTEYYMCKVQFQLAAPCPIIAKSPAPDGTSARRSCQASQFSAPDHVCLRIQGKHNK